MAGQVAVTVVGQGVVSETCDFRSPVRSCVLLSAMRDLKINTLQLVDGLRELCVRER